MSEKLTGYPSIDKPWLKYYTEEDLNFKVPQCSIYDYMYENSKQYSNSIALIYYGVKIKYRTVYKKIEAVAKALKALGVKPSDIVSVCMPNMPEVVYTFYAINRIGAIANMLDPRSSESSLKQALVDSKSKVLLTIDLVEDKFLSVIKDTKVEHLISVSAMNSLPFIFKLSAELKKKKENVMSWTQFIATGKNWTQSIDAKYNANSPAVIAYTGGTTGTPKGVITTNENLNAIIAMNAQMHFPVYPHEKSLDIAPPWTYYGLNNCLNAYLCMGQQIILLPKIGPDELGQVIYKHKPNHIITVPSALVSVMNEEKLQSFDLDFIKTIIVGADKLDETFEADFNRFLKEHNSVAKLSKGYGMTELTAAATYTKDNCNDIGSVGIPYIGNTVSVFETEGNVIKELRIGERGEVAITGPTVTMGYFGSLGSENAEILKLHDDGRTWVHTGDIGHIDENGKLYIDGRLKRMFVRNGYKVFPGEIERQIMKHESVVNCAVVAVTDEISGNTIKAFIKLVDEAGRDVVKNEILEILNDNLYDYEIPEYFEFIDKLPLTGMGKIDYLALEK